MSPSQPISDTHFNRQSYLALLVGVWFTVLSLVVLLLKFAQPTDGWFYTRTEDGLAETVLFQGTEPTPLQVGDVVRQVKGETLKLTGSVTMPLAIPLQMGQTVNYTVQRNGQLQDVVVTLMPRTPQKYDAAKVLADFARTARDETDVNQLTTRLVEVVQETLQPEQVTLWLKPTIHRGWKPEDVKCGQESVH